MLIKKLCLVLLCLIALRLEEKSFSISNILLNAPRRKYQVALAVFIIMNNLIAIGRLYLFENPLFILALHTFSVR